ARRTRETLFIHGCSSRVIDEASAHLRYEALSPLVEGSVVIWGPIWAIKDAKKALSNGLSADTEASVQAERRKNMGESRLLPGEIFMSRAALRAIAF
ncbi:unnamed protein product, partial [Sphacelaria rigidula]